MKIVFLVRRFYPAIGGVEKHTLAVGEELIKLNHQVTVVTLKHKPNLENEKIYRGIKIVRLPDQQNKFFLWKNLWQQRRIIKTADIVHCHDVFWWYMPFLLVYPFKPVFSTFHGWEGAWPVPLKFRLARKIWESLSWGNICVGDYLTKWYGTKADYVTYGGLYNFTFDRKKNYLNGKVKRGIFIGRLSEDNGIKEYLKAFKVLKKQGWKFIFIGDGPYAKSAAKLGLVTGFVSNLRPYLIQPSAIFAASYLTIWEALGYGRKVYTLYQNPLKKEYLEQFPAAPSIHISGSVQELLTQLNQPRPVCCQFPSWLEVAKIYLKLWQEKTAPSI